MFAEPVRRHLAPWLAAAGLPVLLIVTPVVLAVAVVVGSAGPAAAHASFVSAEPSPGTGLPQAPGQVVLEFTEPLVRPPSRIEILDESGTDVGKGDTRAVEGDPTAMRRKLGLLAPGVYTVEWTTLSPVDGHTLTGSYKFAVGGATVGEEAVEADPLSSEGPLGLAGRFVALVGLGLWAGSAALDGVAARAGAPEQARRLLRRVGPPMAAGGTALSLASTALVATGSLSALGQVALSSQSGLLRTGLVAAGVVASLPPVAHRGGDRWLLLVALPAETASGHAGSNPEPLLAAASFTVHLAAVGVWGYAIAVGVLAGRRITQVLAAFVSYAVAAGVVVGLTGLANAALVLTGPGDLATTSYGRMVGVKTVALAVIAVLGLAHNRARTRGAGTRGVRLAVRAEVVAILGTVAVATFLVGFPDPPREEAAHEAAAEADLTLEDLADEPAVSVPAVAGPYVVGLTVTPPKPGDVQLRLRILGAEAGDGLRDATVRATRPDADLVETSLEPCGRGCFAGEATLPGEGRWTLNTTVASNRHPVDVTVEAPLPAPDGARQFARTTTAMEQLRSARVREDLTDKEDGNVVTSEYTFQAPDRMRWEVTSGGSTRIAVGQTGYIKSRQGEPFESYEWPGDGFTWPTGFYESFWQDRAAVRLLGSETLDGVDTTVVGWVQPSYPAWYRMWVSEDTSRVRRLEMRAEGHIMDQVYRAYDEPVTVEPPAEAQPRS